MTAVQIRFLRRPGAVMVSGLLFFLAAIDLYTSGWRSTEFVGSLLMAIGISGMLIFAEPARSEAQQFRSPVYSLSGVLAVIGLALQFADTLARSR